MTKREKVAYFAGIVDGEGSIMLWINKNRSAGGQFNLRINVTSTDKCLIDWIVDNFGGYIYACNSPSRINHPKWKKQYVWQASRPSIASILDDIFPFLIIKKEHCKIAMKFRETFAQRECPLSKETYEIRLKLYEQIKHLNTRGL